MPEQDMLDWRILQIHKHAGTSVSPNLREEGLELLESHDIDPYTPQFVHGFLLGVFLLNKLVSSYSLEQIDGERLRQVLITKAKVQDSAYRLTHILLPFVPKRAFREYVSPRLPLRAPILFDDWLNMRPVIRLIVSNQGEDEVDRSYADDFTLKEEVILGKTRIEISSRVFCLVQGARSLTSSVLEKEEIGDYGRELVCKAMVEVLKPFIRYLPPELVEEARNSL